MSVRSRYLTSPATLTLTVIAAVVLAAFVAWRFRLAFERRGGDRARSAMYIVAGGLLAGSALTSFVVAIWR